MNHVINMVKFNKFNFLKKEFEKYGQQSKNFDCENRRQEHTVES